MSQPCALTADMLLADPEIQEILTRKGYTRLSLVYDLGRSIYQFDRTMTGECLHRLATEVAAFRRKALKAVAARNRPPPPPPPPRGVPTVLYRHWDAEGRLLYIGISHDAERRLREHRQCSPWAPQIAKVEMVEYRSRPEAARAERNAIRAENPIHNVERYTPTASRSEVTASDGRA